MPPLSRELLECSRPTSARPRHFALTPRAPTATTDRPLGPDPATIPVSPLEPAQLTNAATNGDPLDAADRAEDGEAHPERCSGFILRGIFLCRRSEIDWFLYGLRTFFPEAWRSFAAAVSESERGDLLAAYYRRVTDPDPRVHMPAARAWSTYEGVCSTLLPSPETVAYFASDVVALGLARIEAHYFTHDIFLPENALLGNLGRIRHIPGVIVQGRYDSVCPVVTADEVHEAWPEAEYIVVPDAGHSAWEPGICARLLKAAEAFKRRGV